MTGEPTWRRRERLGARVTASGLSPSVLRAEPVQVLEPVEAWEAQGRRIWQTVNRASWERGDWWAFGEDQGYGERKAIAERIGFEFSRVPTLGRLPGHSKLPDVGKFCPSATMPSLSRSKKPSKRHGSTRRLLVTVTASGGRSCVYGAS